MQAARPGPCGTTRARQASLAKTARVAAAVHVRGADGSARLAAAAATAPSPPSRERGRLPGASIVMVSLGRSQLGLGLQHLQRLDGAQCDP
eukprot:2431285-Pyramimonas_sp.AAC.1